MAVEALASHPLVFNEAYKTLNISIVDPVLYIKTIKNQCHIYLEPFREQSGVEVVSVSSSLLHVVRFTTEHAEIAQLTSASGIMIPKGQLSQVKGVIQTLSPMVHIHSDVYDDDPSQPIFSGDSEPVIRLYMNHGTLKVEVVIVPCDKTKASFIAGQGTEAFFENIDGQVVKVVRNLSDEKERYLELMNHCSLLGMSDDDSAVWLFDNPELAMEVIDQIYQVKDHYRVEWPTGQKLLLHGEPAMEALSLRIKHDRGWFKVDGKLQVGKNSQIELKELLSKVSSGGSNFIKLMDNTFIKLNNHLKDVLDELNSVLENSSEDLAFLPFKLQVLAQSFDKNNVQVKGDLQWRNQLKACLDAFNLEVKVPHTFAAKLRDYQFDGFQWLARIAQANAGACLADDMGLGKTVQSLALLTYRAEHGPSWVVAPASVCHNWYDETNKFAPTLRPILLANAQDRFQTLKQLKSHDLVICSYALLNSLEEALSPITWSTVVLDEAQMIKNHGTARYQAALKLQAGFRMIATGTPVENNLTELWNLFNFINPGLLGQRRAFFDKYVQGIERHNDKRIRLQLRNLIKPFVLRRMKSDVLGELPEKTEITLSVDLSQREHNFYHLLREEVINSLDNFQPGSKGIHVLSGITKLRRAACSPQLLVPEQQENSAKLVEMVQLVKELVANGHKALIFSQFTDYLKLAQQAIQNLELTSFYLDGSTPQNRRQKLVKSFQSGDADLFFISLKAGGTGLNLTEADYVIHLDPWWNPAVEDQASDRVHRIGQERPVTVYRLISAGTIEEKITALHEQKRQLADAMLDSTSSLSVDQLLQLLHS